MSTEKKKWISVIAFTLVLAFAIWLTAAVFNVKSADLWPSSRNVLGFYEEPEQSIDVLYLGTSHLMCSCSPMLIWEKTGITGYNLSTERQYLGLSYYWVQEVFKYQSPKLVVLDGMSLLAWPFSGMESRQRKALDYMRWSETKVAAIDAVCEYDQETDKLSYYLPFLMYHSRWDELTKSDFSFVFEDKKYIPKGYFVCYEGGDEAYADCDFMPVTGEHKVMAMATIEYFDMIQEYCQERGAELLVIVPPRTEQWSQENHDDITAFTQSRGVNFLDFNTPEMLEELDFDHYTDMYDPWHCSGFGGDKVSAWLADYLAENYSFDAHDDVTTDRWDLELAQYKEMVAQDTADRALRKAQEQAEADAAEAAAEEAEAKDVNAA